MAITPAFVRMDAKQNYRVGRPLPMSELRKGHDRNQRLSFRANFLNTGGNPLKKQLKFLMIIIRLVEISHNTLSASWCSLL